MAQARDVPPIFGLVSFDGRMVQITFEGDFAPLVAGLNPNHIPRGGTGPDLQQDKYAAQLADFAPGFVRNLMLGTRGHMLNPVVKTQVNQDTGSISVDMKWPQGAGILNMYWPRGYGDLVLRKPATQWDAFLIGGETVDVPLYDGRKPGRIEAFLNYIPVGIDRIIPYGLAHVMFVLGLFFYSSRLSNLVTQLGVFGIGHILSLGVIAWAGVTIPAAHVAVILVAVTTYIGVENIVARGRSMLRMPVVLGFGVVHGMGLGAMLRDYGVAQSQFTASLFGLMAGFGIGQFLVASGAILLTYRAAQVDHKGMGARKTAAIGYGLGVLACLVFGLIWWPALSDIQHVYGVIGFAGLLMCLSSVSILNAEGLYRPRVAIPASLTITLMALYWLFQDLFW